MASNDIVEEELNLESAICKMTIDETGKYDKEWLKGTAAESEINLDNKSSVDFSHPIFKTISKLNGKINSMSYFELSKCLKDLKLDPSGKKEVLIKRLKSYQKQLHLNRENLSVRNHDTTQAAKNVPTFDYICVIDFEATCDEVNKQNYVHEIIEFPIVLINLKTMSIEDTFQKYVKPTLNPILTKFCVHLTGITQEQVDNANTFPVVLEEVNQWFLEKGLGTTQKFAIASDGPWDFENFLNLQCYQSGIKYPLWARRWVDVRKLFANWFNLRRCGIEKMLHYLGLEFEGKQHCGLDDAKNISRILMKLLSDGCELKLNERIRNCRSIIETIDDSNVDMKVDETQ